MGQEENNTPTEGIEPSPIVSAPKDTPLHIRFMISLRTGVLRRLVPVWAVSMVVSLFVIYMLDTLLPFHTAPIVETGSALFFGTFIVSLVCMYVDSTLGMGYGTTLTPILLLIGYDVLSVVPALLVTQFLAGIAAGVSHQSAGNIDLSKGSMHLKITSVLALCGIVGSLIAVKGALSIDEKHLTLAIGLIVVIVGIVILITRGQRFHFSWRKIVFLGLVASFNKGLSAGGYGPIVTGGQILSGVGGRHAIGITALTEGLTCLVATMAWLASGRINDLSAAYPLVLGAVCSVPLSAYTVRKLTIRRLTTAIGSLTVILGLVTLYKVYTEFYG
ncbi:MAG TPA: sulfite exporter TauE/SafE family protein [Firmicutes bacterium]|nr:sulfite exporter TauE/SafE family protein [Bacillota bacterium]